MAYTQRQRLRAVCFHVLSGGIDPVNSDCSGAMTNIDELIHRAVVSIETWMHEAEAQFYSHSKTAPNSQK
jgi:hypothetical protein